MPRDKIVMTEAPVSKDHGTFLLDVDLDVIGLVDQYGLSRKVSQHIFEPSSERLQLEYIDRDTPIAALHDMIKAVYVRYTGMSSRDADHFHAMSHGPTPFVYTQNHYNLVRREEEREIFPTLKVETSILMPPKRLSEDSTRGSTVGSSAEEIAIKRGISMAQVRTTTSPRARCTFTDSETLGGVHVQLMEEEIKYLEDASGYHWPPVNLQSATRRQSLHTITPMYTLSEATSLPEIPLIEHSDKEDASWYSVRLGKFGLKVSRIILSCMQYSSTGWRDRVIEDEEVVKHVKMAYDAGINAFDTVNRIFDSVKHSLERVQSDYTDLQYAGIVTKTRYVRSIGMRSCWAYQCGPGHAKTIIAWLTVRSGRWPPTLEDGRGRIPLGGTHERNFETCGCRCSASDPFLGHRQGVVFLSAP
ncbi:hypothetical protein NEOLEDRAFT_1144843 [Neolentinus lepideus HHB14362 ss-1]|uniref:NADP-dependent oxidoreductase domain-containing protein n=1 Tax=Neolentinus lepideus HHB14362 ss-1 TaxID=1314782 RepID=A0A165VJ00_9AGAM|nr:hypothetical protein NEOLEDRAFT_1144843 [Neolentinus lepideus HHB14362 ss-1]